MGNARRAALLRAVNRVSACANNLSAALESLGELASAIYGEDLRADLCNGHEIEFRHISQDGYVDAYDTIRVEEILDRL